MTEGRLSRDPRGCVTTPRNLRERHPMTTLTELARTMQDLLTTKADQLARSCGFVKRKRKITGANFAQTVVFTALADSDAPKSRAQVIAAAIGVKVSRQALDKRY